MGVFVIRRQGESLPADLAEVAKRGAEPEPRSVRQTYCPSVAICVHWVMLSNRITNRP